MRLGIGQFVSRANAASLSRREFRERERRKEFMTHTNALDPLRVSGESVDTLSTPTGTPSQPSQLTHCHPDIVHSVALIVLALIKHHISPSL